MPTLHEIKEMLKKAELEAEAAVESALGIHPVGTADAAPPAAPEATPEPAPAVATEPVFITEEPYGIVDGVPGVKYQQFGEYFDSQRKFVRKA